MFKAMFMFTIGAAMTLLAACDQRDYRPNADPLGLEDSESTPESSDLPELPTLSDVEQQQDNESSPQEPHEQ